MSVALSDALDAMGGLWFGWNGTVDPAARAKPPELEPAGRYVRASIALTADEQRGYYLGFANGCLWPAFHYRLDLMAYRPEDWRQYCRVNARFARQLLPLLSDGDLVWVHDFHLILVGEELRKLGWRGPIGFFLHTPFPAPEIFAGIPGHDHLARALLAFDVIGFQTRADRRNFVSHMQDAHACRDAGDGWIQALGRTAYVGTFPVGIDDVAVADLAAQLPASRKSERQLIVGVDRLDYTKGLPQRLLAFERLLERDPQRRGKVSFIQVAPPTRDGVPGYAELRREVQQLVGHINGRFSTFDWSPVTFINRQVDRAELLRLFRCAAVGLVTPLRDGMNLVAKEFVAAQDPADPGMLILSRFAGAAETLTAALLVNPHDIDAVATTLGHALDMPVTQRRMRQKWLRAQIARTNAALWREKYLQALAAAGNLEVGETDPVLVGAA